MVANNVTTILEQLEREKCKAAEQHAVALRTVQHLDAELARLQDARSALLGNRGTTVRSRKQVEKKSTVVGQVQPRVQSNLNTAPVDRTGREFNVSELVELIEQVLTDEGRLTEPKLRHKPAEVAPDRTRRDDGG